MTKERVFDLLEKAVTHIGENFNMEEREVFLDEQLTHENFPIGDYSIDSGISKAVIIIKGAPFVIKMPFFKIYDDSSYCDAYSTWEEEKDDAYIEYVSKRQKELNNQNYTPSNEERISFFKEWTKTNPEPEDDDELFYYDIEGASNIDLAGQEEEISDWNYCQLETILYNLAVEEGLGAYFAEEGYLGVIDQTPVYYQTRCIPMNSITIDYNSKEYKQKKIKSRAFCDKLNISCFNDVWISDFIDMYGENEFLRLNSFLDRYDIGDLRTCNIGYLDDAPILFDYSGFRDWF